MEVVCGGECFTAAGIPCRRELWTLGGRKAIKKDDNQTIALAVGRNVETESGMGSPTSVLKTAGCASRDNMVYGAVHQIYLVTNCTIIEVTLFCSD
jgi:hypothetical protein